MTAVNEQVAMACEDGRFGEEFVTPKFGTRIGSRRCMRGAEAAVGVARDMWANAACGIRGMGASRMLEENVLDLKRRVAGECG